MKPIDTKIITFLQKERVLSLSVIVPHLQNPPRDSVDLAQSAPQNHTQKQNPLRDSTDSTSPTARNLTHDSTTDSAINAQNPPIFTRDSTHFTPQYSTINAQIPSQNLTPNLQNLSLDSIDSKQDSAPISPLTPIYSANCYYAPSFENLALIFKSRAESFHIQCTRIAPHIALTIARDSRILRGIKGVQATAILRPATRPECGIYYRRFPFARLWQGELFALEILWLKYTDNTLPRKLFWQRNNHT